MKFNYLRIAALFILFIGVGAFTSCSSLTNDSNDDDNANAAYVGEWKLVSATFTGETAEPADFAGFAIKLNSTGTYVLTNPNNFTSPTDDLVGTYNVNGSFITFNPGAEVNVTGIGGNTMSWEWQVAKPGKMTATYRYTFERI
ncbi:hypothetical protein [Bernardetia sp.]|uniref:hypothetical protein n=1 Tax=Bernardetia sp. TaxID=1937974 RepID=UPI0025C6BE68|nr:hypothetical protein [Bernardetia sp.]